MWISLALYFKNCQSLHSTILHRTLIYQHLPFSRTASFSVSENSYHLPFRPRATTIDVICQNGKIRSDKYNRVKWMTNIWSRAKIIEYFIQDEPSGPIAYWMVVEALVLVQSNPNFQDSWEGPSWECANLHLVILVTFAGVNRIYWYLSTVEGFPGKTNGTLTH